MVGGVPFLVFFFPLEHGEIDHPGKGHHVLVGQVEPVAEEQAQRAQGLVGHGLLVGDEEDQVAFFRAGERLEGVDFFGRDELLGGALHAFGGQRQGGQAFGALFFGEGGQVIDLFAGIFGAAGDDDALDHPPALSVFWKTMKLAAGEDFAERRTVPCRSAGRACRSRSGLTASV